MEIYKLLWQSKSANVGDIITKLSSVEHKQRRAVKLNQEEQEFAKVSKLTGYGMQSQINFLIGLTLTPQQQEIVVRNKYEMTVIRDIATIKDEEVKDRVIIGLKEVAETRRTQEEVIRAIKADPEIADLLTVIPPKDVELTHEQILDMEHKIERAKEMEVEVEDYEKSEQGVEQARLIRNWMAHNKLLEGAAQEPFCPKCGKDVTHLRWVCCDLQLAPDAGMLATKAAQTHTNKVIADMLQDRVDYEKTKKESKG